ncbi:MAG: O-antigen ligase family protein [Limnobacter sp.]|uniref:O-antigen ligase family protein n=1 Tax=Limnobacter sp. TaxID=2003368 RepID=UPI003919C22E
MHAHSPRSFPTALLIVAMGLAGCLIGIYATLFSSQPLLLVGPPLLIPLLVMLWIRPVWLFMGLLLFRCALDPALESARFSNSVGMGAALNVLIVACALVWLIQSTGRLAGPIVRLWAAPLAVMTLGVFLAPDTTPALKKLMAFVSYGAVFAMGYWCFLEKRLSTLLKVLVCSAIIPVLAGLLQMLTGSLGTEGRMSGTFTHPNIFAFYCLLILIVITARPWLSVDPSTQQSGQDGWRKVELWGLVPALVLCVLMTQTRSAWLALVLAALIYGLTVSRWVLSGLAVAVLIAAFTPAVQDRVMDLFSGNEVVQYAKLNSFAWRQYIWESGLNWMSPARQWLGYGLGGFMFYSPDFFPLSGGRQFGAHNVFVERYFDGGVLAVAVFGLFVGAQLLAACRLWQHAPRLGMVYLALLLSYLTLNTSDNVVDYLAYNWYFWALAGAFYALAQQAKADLVRPQ